MKKTWPVIHYVIICLLLHTAIIIFLAYIAIQGALQSTGSWFILAFFSGAVATTAYTVIKIRTRIHIEHLLHNKALAQNSAIIQNASEKLIEYAGKLNQRESIMNERQDKFDKHANMLNDYSKIINELVAAGTVIPDRRADYKIE